jgi:large subunit ribosomal protein L23
MNDLSQVIKTIRLSEKATILGEELNEYVFEVHKDSNKIDIKHAVQLLFGKKVADVRTMNYDGKPKSRGRAIGGRTVHWKKAVVRLKEGEKIDLV